MIVVIICVGLYCCRKQRNLKKRADGLNNQNDVENNQHSIGSEVKEERMVPCASTSPRPRPTNATPSTSPCVTSPATNAPPGYCPSQDPESYSTVDDSFVPIVTTVPPTPSNSASTASGSLSGKAVLANSSVEGSPSPTSHQTSLVSMHKPEQTSNYNALFFNQRPEPAETATARGTEDLYNHLESVVAGSENRAKISLLFHATQPNTINPETHPRERKKEEYNHLDFSRNRLEVSIAKESVDGGGGGGKIICIPTPLESTARWRGTGNRK
ncbi:hypothetical protein ACOMHN_019547 [Nucella lapillus]